MNPKLWNEKPYVSLDYYLKKTFGEKVYKVSLDAGMTCPNRDGTLDTRGCIFCSSGGSGDFAAPPCHSVTTQIDTAIAGIRSAKANRGKKPGATNKVANCNKFIAYFQAYTNTYAPIERLREIFTQALSHPSIVALSIGTRPDCLGTKVLELLEELNTSKWASPNGFIHKPVWVELGLQTFHEATASFIRRGYPLSVFEDTVSNLHQRNLDTIVHLIVGLPYETKDDMLTTINYVANLPIQGVKLQLLHVLKGTDLAEYLGDFKILSIEEYVDLIITCLEYLPETMVIHRITGDGPRSLLLEPQWSIKKKVVMNTIHKTLKERNTWQGRLYKQT